MDQSVCVFSCSPSVECDCDKLLHCGVSSSTKIGNPKSSYKNTLLLGSWCGLDNWAVDEGNINDITVAVYDKYDNFIAVYKRGWLFFFFI